MRARDIQVPPQDGGGAGGDVQVRAWDVQVPGRGVWNADARSPRETGRREVGGGGRAASAGGSAALAEGGVGAGGDEVGDGR
ncbi:hypothetical protein AB0J52_19885, partial [Spirillospora sp. NPDC049652]